MTIGDLVWVRWSSWGRQRAQVLSLPKRGRVTVKKWRANSRRWTGPVRVPVSDLIGENWKPIEEVS